MIGIDQVISRRRTTTGFVEATFHIPEDLMRALKMRAVQNNKRFSKVAEDALRQYLGFPHLFRRDMAA
jgi:hypothetical protein